MEKLDRATHVLQVDGAMGEVQIADEVVAIIAGMAATEVKGVASMAGNIKNELVAKMGMKNLSKGVKVEVTDTDVKVDLALNLVFEANILEVSGKVQEKVISAIESMTGMKVSTVNVRVAGVVLE
ncbi:MAG: Asp23/Gls24 family envelope stress response protein [Lachnospiraceae bacterium]|nr:Asp23/Gls24 family envelope stress response protein [Lachnospiraceae bacterium]